ncbi:DUF2157 domain-containing protein [Kribbella sindirgiensis]|uniref:DUF2157 domain-containing protein n=1 Tax=Kribbella sindirgiensis TaxID=1124744 RepID=A0A4R0IA58_9ACTN|nr:DUF2157 domain-containing protein [Kribbella sindirgiensis]TCC24342.1 DUF2157 domain-containing protein [Kribbella sindirgiensis]
MRASSNDRRSVSNLIDHWVAEGLITAGQAERMHDELGRPAPRTPADDHGRTSLVVESLAYLGGVIVLVAAGLISARYWSALGTTGQLAVVGGAAAALLLAGGMVTSPSAPGVRLRSVLWLLSTAGTGAFLALFADVVLDFDGSAIGALAGGGAAALASVLWWRLPVLTQQAAFFVAAMLTAGATVAELTSDPQLPGLAVWGTGAIWFLLGWRDLVKPRRPVQALAAAAALIGALMTLPADAGMVLALCTVVAVVVLAVVFGDLLLLAVGALGALNILPVVVNEWFPGDLAAPLVLLVVGALLVTTAVHTARKGKP